VECNVATVVQTLDLVAHVLEEETVLFQVDFQATAKQAQKELDAFARDNAFAVSVHKIPDDLEVADVVVALQKSDILSLEEKTTNSRVVLTLEGHLPRWSRTARSSP